MSARHLTVIPQQYSRIVSTMMQNDAVFSEHTHGSTKRLLSKNKLIALREGAEGLNLGDLTKQQFISFLGAFSRNLYSQFAKNEHLFTLEIRFEGFSRSKNVEYWEEMKVGQYFYNVDLSSAYWQMAHRLKYISTKMFNTYMDADSYKQAKRYCISFLARGNKMTYYKKGGIQEIQCDTSILRRAYDNIRHELYNTIQGAIQGKNYMEYNIDGVTINADDLKNVLAYFKSEGLRFKVTQCQKVSETQYLYRNTLRNFKPKQYATQIITSTEMQVSQGMDESRWADGVLSRVIA